MTDGASRTLAWRAVLTATGIDAISILPGFLVASLAVRIHADIGLTTSQLGVVIGAFFGAAALASVPAGRLTERVGWPAALRGAALLASASMTAIAVLAHSVAALIGWSGVAGLASAVAHPASNLAVARRTPGDRRGFVFGVKHAAVPAATLLGGLAVPSLALTLGWRWAFAAGAALGIAGFLAVPRPAPVDRPRPPAHAGAPTGRSVHRGLLVLLAIAAGLGIAGVDSLASFIVSYAVAMGVPEGTAGFVLAVGSVAGIITRIVFGLLVDKRAGSDLTTVAALLVAGAVGVVGLSTGGVVGLYAGGLLAFVGCWGWSGLFTFAVVRDHEDSPAAATAVTQTGKLVGAGLGPVVFGFVADFHSYEWAWWATSASLVGAALLMLAVHRRRPTPVPRGGTPPT